MSKVTVIGAGNVGATVGNVLATKDIVREVVLLDIRGDFAKGKALDAWQQSPIEYNSTRMIGTDDYAMTADSDIGLRYRRRCMSRSPARGPSCRRSR